MCGPSSFSLGKTDKDLLNRRGQRDTNSSLKGRCGQRNSERWPRLGGEEGLLGVSRVGMRPAKARRLGGPSLKWTVPGEMGAFIQKRRLGSLNSDKAGWATGWRIWTSESEGDRRLPGAATQRLEPSCPRREQGGLGPGGPVRGAPSSPSLWPLQGGTLPNAPGLLPILPMEVDELPAECV